jgi:hypothetical protein
MGNSPNSGSPVGLLLSLPRLVMGVLKRKPAQKKAPVAAAVESANQATLPVLFCFGCRTIIPLRPCEACDRETEIFVVTTETDRRLLVGRLTSEGP